MQPEPGPLQARVHDIEPQRHLGQLHRGLVEVDAVALVQGEVGLDLLLLGLVVVRREPDPLLLQLLLAPFQVLAGELVDRLVEERAAAERRLAHRQL